MTPPAQKYSGRGGLAIRRTFDGGLRAGLPTLDLTGGAIVTAIDDCRVKEFTVGYCCARKHEGSRARGGGP